jgi:hypothetical protein
MAKKFSCAINMVKTPAHGVDGDADYTPAVIKTIKIYDGQMIGGAKVSLSKLAFLFSSESVTSITTVNYAREVYHQLVGSAGQENHDRMIKGGAWITFESEGEFRRDQTIGFCDAFLDAVTEVAKTVAKVEKTLPTRGLKVDLAPAAADQPAVVDVNDALAALFTD